MPTPPFTLPDSWQTALRDELSLPYVAKLAAFVAGERASGVPIYPAANAMFHALELTPLDRVRVVILGQDPYHGTGQAHGLAFSVLPGVRVPPSLRNIYKELQTDLGIAPPSHGYLEYWAEQGVLLLNSVVTVKEGKAASHQGRGWERLTDAIVQLVNARAEPTVFLLWGAYAQKKAGFVDDVTRGGQHLVLRAAHPSPLSAHNGFFGCRHFSQTNDFLVAQGRQAVDWTLPLC